MSEGPKTPEQAVRVHARLERAAQVERDKEAAWAEIAATNRRVDENTARLRLLRMEKEKSEAAASAAAEQPKARPKRTARTTRR